MEIEMLWLTRVADAVRDATGRGTGPGRLHYMAKRLSERRYSSAFARRFCLYDPVTSL